LKQGASNTDASSPPGAKRSSTMSREYRFDTLATQRVAVASQSRPGLWINPGIKIVSGKILAHLTKQIEKSGSNLIRNALFLINK
jgi:hypothetical protein